MGHEPKRLRSFQSLLESTHPGKTQEKAQMFASYAHNKPHNVTHVKVYTLFTKPFRIFHHHTSKVSSLKVNAPSADETQE